MQKISYYVRPWSINYFKYIAKNTFPDKSNSFVSDFRGLCENDLSINFYKENIESPIDISSDEINDIVRRDRMLRNLNRDFAEKLLLSMYSSIYIYINDTKPDVFISVTIDSYVIDLINLVCKKNKIPFYGFHLTMISDYSLITARGEENNFRDVGGTEIENIYKTICSGSYTVSYVDNKNPDFFVGFKRWLRSAIKIPYFNFIRYFKNDRYNYHYYATILMSKRRLKAGNLFFSRHFDSNWKEAKVRHKYKIYMPIQFHPECNSEYWPEYSELMPYEEGFLKVLKILSKFAHVYVKEHPEMIGLRDSGFYDSISRVSNVSFVPVGVSQERLIDFCDASATWNSSVGIESVLKGTPVITFAQPNYAQGRGFLNINSLNDVDLNVKRFLDSNIVISESEKKVVIKTILSSSIYGHPDECYFSLGNRKKKTDADRVIKSLKCEFDNWLAWKDVDK